MYSAPLTQPRYEGACALDDDTLLVFGKVAFCMDDGSELKLAGKTIKKPYRGAVFSTPVGEYYVLLLSQTGIGYLQSLQGLELKNSDAPAYQFGKQRVHHSNAESFWQLFDELSKIDRETIFGLFTQYLEEKPAMGQSSAFVGMCLQLHHRLLGPKLNMSYGAWLSPSVLYFEGKLEGILPKKAELLVMSSTPQHKVPVTITQVSHSDYAAIAVFDKPVYFSDYENFILTVFEGNQLIPVTGSITAKCYGLEFPEHVNGKEDFARHVIRETVCKHIIEHTAIPLQEGARELLRKLQYFVKTTPLDCSDTSIPFGIHFERVIPISSQGVFVYGWINDPYHMLEDIEAISDLGYSLSLKSHLHRFGRGDVQDHFRNSPYGGLDDQMGIVGFAQFDAKTAKRLGAFGSLHNFRFNVKLAGGVTILINPVPKYTDAFAARDFVLKGIAQEAVSDAMLAGAIGPAASLLQTLCMQQIGVKEVVQYGTPPKSPQISLIIPLYKQLGFLKIQFATLARDTDREHVEIIFVLDSPEQEKDVRNLLIAHSELYDVPVTLVIMKRNAGYAAANNAGAKYARGKYLVLLNSDVFAKTRNWAMAMATYYAANPKIGALAPKLLYEDGSLQHAGMFFAKSNYPFWLNIHYHKGFPSDHPPACINRPVPAVTGACLMVRKDLYDKVGGLTTDYVIGDFEDSDLCLKLAALGYESWYCADMELYHLERQSVGLNMTYSGGLAWRHNANTHMGRWNEVIELQMEAFGTIENDIPTTTKLKKGKQ